MGDSLDRDRWLRIKALVEATLDQPEEVRESYLDRECRGDVALRAGVRSLVDAHEKAPREFLDNPPADSVHHDDDPLVLDDEVPGYTIRHRLGDGGMGEVWLADDADGRPVAVKLIKLGMDSKETLARFRMEQRSLAQMDHEDIARVHDTGLTKRGRSYFVMDYVDGESIANYCDRHRLPICARLELFARVCEAIHHAHRKGILHRDLKPTNILVQDGKGGPRPTVIDFGIAKATQEEPGATALTRTGLLVGTPEYMSPEQLDPSAGQLDERTDVFALGVVLHELLTGARPIDKPKPSGSDPGALRQWIHAPRAGKELEPTLPHRRGYGGGHPPPPCAGKERSRLSRPSYGAAARPSRSAW